MKLLTLLAVQVITSLISKGSMIWVGIEFIMYLAKDKEFNWLSIWILIISTVISIATTFILITKKNKREGQKKPDIKKSIFQQRLEEMKKNKDSE